MASPSISIAIGATDGFTPIIRKINTGLEDTVKRFQRANTSVSRFGDVTGISRVASGLGDVHRRMERAAATLGRFAPALAGLASAATLGGIGDLVRQFTTFGSALGLASTRANLTATQLHGMQGAARLAGSSAESLTSGVTALQDNLSNATRGQAPEFVGLMGSLGIAFTDASGHARQAADVMPQLANAIAHARGPTEAAIIATRAFGAAGESLLPYFRRGAAGVAEYNAQAARHGLLNERGVAASNAMREAQTNLSEAFEGLGYTISERVAPVLVPLLTRLSDWVDAHREQIGGFFERVAKGIESWVSSGGLDRMIDRFERLYNSMAAVERFAESVGHGARSAYNFITDPLDIHNPTGPLTIIPTGRQDSSAGTIGPSTVQTWWHRHAPTWLGGGDAPGSAPGTLLPPGDPRLPRGIRNNNPTNLEYVPGQQGAIGSDGRFGRYGTMQLGVAAGLRQLLLYQDRDHLASVGAMIGRWAPAGENNTNAYAARVAASLGVDPNTPVNLHDPQVAARMISAMAMVENGRAVDPTQVRQGVDSVLSPAARFGFPMHDDPSTWPVAAAPAPVVPIAAPSGAAGAAGPSGDSTVRVQFENPPPGMKTSTVSTGGLRVETRMGITGP